MNHLLSLWSAHEAELRRWLSARSPDPGEVDDMLQDVFLKTLKQGGQLAAVAQPRAWLYKVARNTLIDRLRQSRHTCALPEGLDELPALVELPDPVDRLAQACLPRVLSELSPQDREAIELCDLQGMAQADFARLRGLSLAGAKSRVQRARRRMRERMSRECQLTFDPDGHVDDFVPWAPLLSPEQSPVPHPFPAKAK